MDSHPEQIALRPKEFFRSYDIEVLTEMQVRRALCVPAGIFCDAGRQRLCLGNVEVLSVLNSLDTIAETFGLPQAPCFVPQSAGCLWLFKTTVNGIPPVTGKTPCANSIHDPHFLPTICEHPHLDLG